MARCIGRLHAGKPARGNIIKGDAGARCTDLAVSAGGLKFHMFPACTMVRFRVQDLGFLHMECGAPVDVRVHVGQDAPLADALLRRQNRHRLLAAAHAQRCELAHLRQPLTRLSRRIMGRTGCSRVQAARHLALPESCSME